MKRASDRHHPEAAARRSLVLAAAGLLAAGALLGIGAGRPRAAEASRPAPALPAATAQSGGTLSARRDQRSWHDEVFIVGGRDNEGKPVKSVEFYDAAGDRFWRGPDNSDIQGLHTATRLADGRVLIVGNVGSRLVARAVVYDPRHQSLRSAARRLRVEALDLVRPRSQIDRSGHTATLLKDGKVLIVGGHNRFYRALAAAELYDPARSAFGSRQKRSPA
ncbi:MAG: hypothetical protein M1336_06020, partial [Deltaproteobacteria bacterium]|nr:hypothetical protein [Deltaproteobacteria bacterium]